MRKFILISVTFILLLTFILSILFFSYMHPSYDIYTVGDVEVYKSMGFVVLPPSDTYLNISETNNGSYLISFNYDLNDYTFKFNTIIDYELTTYSILSGEFSYNVGSDVIGSNEYHYSSVVYDVDINAVYDSVQGKYEVISVYVPLNAWNVLGIVQNYTEYLKENFPRFPTMSDNVEVIDYLKDILNVFYFPNDLMVYVFDIFSGLDNILGGELLKGGDI